jgi:hypothetical protein
LFAAPSLRIRLGQGQQPKAARHGTGEGIGLLTLRFRLPRARHLTTDSNGSQDWPPVRPNWSPLLHFPQIIWLAMKSSKPREWTELEVKTLISMSGQRHSADEISKSLGRYVGSVKTKARQLGLVAVKKRSEARRRGAD